MRTVVRVVGALWILQGLALATEEVMRVMRGGEGVSLGVALLLYALVIGVGVYILVQARGWTVVAFVAAAYQGVSHFIFLSNVWPEFDYNAGFSLFVVCIALATGVVAIAQWFKKRSGNASSITAS